MVSNSQSRPELGPQEGSVENQKLWQAFLLVVLVTLAGTIGFSKTEGWHLWKAFYFTLTTITTVGYGDEGLSDPGKRFATFLLIGGVSSASYALAMIIQNSVAAQFAWRKHMNKRIQKLKKHTIICGFGRLGASVAEKLAASNSPFVVVERDTERFMKALDLGYLALQGQATEDECLHKAGIMQANHVVAAVQNFAENIVITMDAKELNPDAILIARAERDDDVRRLERAGAQRVLCPYKSGGRETFEFITRPGVADFLAEARVGGGGVALAQIHVQPGAQLEGVSLGEFGQLEGDRLSFVAFERTGEEVKIPPGGNTELAAGDTLIVAGDPEQIARMTQKAAGRNLAA
ncbi:MAG: potassium channel protein [Planctomycetota bacterium]|nr:potassium channel protein [Planctomycetota bacterium]